jgi:hypothetical protein
LSTTITDVGNTQIELLALVASKLNDKDLARLRGTSRMMLEAANEAAKVRPTGIEKWALKLQNKYRKRVQTLYNIAYHGSNSLAQMSADLKASKPPIFADKESKADFKKKKASVINALINLANDVHLLRLSCLRFEQKVIKLRRILEDDLKALASADPDERANKRGGQSNMTYDLVNRAFRGIDTVQSGILLAKKHIAACDRQVAQLKKELGVAFDVA